LQEEIKDEGDVQGQIKRDKIKSKLIILFRDTSAQKVLSEGHRNAILEFLQKHVEAFSSSKIKREQLF